MRRGWGAAALIGAALVAGVAYGAKSPLQTEPWAEGRDAEWERFLLEAEIVEKKPVGTGVTRPFKIRLALDGREAHAIWKTIDKEQTHTDAEGLLAGDPFFSDKWHYEVSAYRLDRMIGLNRVPVTVVRRIDKEYGSLQLWVENAITERARVEGKVALEDVDRFNRGSREMKLFDALIHNRDRTQENILLVYPGNHVRLIDHSRAFRLNRKLPRHTVKKGMLLEAAMRERLAALDLPALRSALDVLLTKNQIAAILRRRDEILAITSTP